MSKKKTKSHSHVSAKQLKAQLAQVLGTPPFTATPPQNQRLFTIKARQMGKSTVAQAAQTQRNVTVMQKLIDDYFFRTTPLMAYLNKHQAAPFSGGPFVDDDSFYKVDAEGQLPPHEPGELCEHNPYCEECYA